MNVVRKVQALSDQLESRMVWRLRIEKCIPVCSPYGCTLYFCMSEDMLRECRNKTQMIRMELHIIDGFPIVKIEVKIFADSPVKMDCFLNVNDSLDLESIESLTKQDSVIFHIYDKNIKYVRSTMLEWPEESRQRAEEIVEVIKNTLSKYGGGNFEKAKAKYLNGD